jgi:hypothetical protein
MCRPLFLLPWIHLNTPGSNVPQFARTPVLDLSVRNTALLAKQKSVTIKKGSEDEKNFLFSCSDFMVAVHGNAD